MDRAKKYMCPLMSIGYAVEVAVSAGRGEPTNESYYGYCVGDDCAMWTTYGCGLSNMETKMSEFISVSYVPAKTLDEGDLL